MNSYNSILRTIGIRQRTNEAVFLVVSGSRQRTITLQLSPDVASEIGRRTGKAFSVWSDRHIDNVTHNSHIISLAEV
jgi:hypothetical protein